MVIVPLSVQEHSNWTKETSLINKGKNQNGCESIWKKGKGRKHKKLLNIKNTNLIKACLEFFSRSLLPSGKKKCKSSKSTLHYGPCLQIQSNLSLLSASSRTQSYQTVSLERLVSMLLLPQDSTQKTVPSGSLFWLQSTGQVIFLMYPQAPWASQYHSLFHTVHLVEIVMDCLLINLLPSTLSFFPVRTEFIHSCFPCALHNN